MMNKSHEELLHEAFQNSIFTEGYQPDELEEYHGVYLLGDIPVFAHFHYPKGSLRPDYQIEVIHGDAVMNVLNDKNRLLDFVRAIADGDKKSQEEATLLLASLNNEQI